MAPGEEVWRRSAPPSFAPMDRPPAIIRRCLPCRAGPAPARIMTDVLLLPPMAWHSGAGIVTVSFHAPCAGGLAILAEGWSQPDAARLVSSGGTPQTFLPLAEGAFLATATEDGAVFTIEAPVAPMRCRVVFVRPPASSPTFALLAPRALRRPRRPASYDPVAGQGRVVAALAVHDLDTALGVAAEMLVATPRAGQTLAAVATVLAHLARFPLSRSPALGAFVAALTE